MWMWFGKPREIGRIMRLVRRLPLDHQMRVLRLVEILSSPAHRSPENGRRVLELLSNLRLMSNGDIAAQLDTAILDFEDQMSNDGRMRRAFWHRVES
jgi:hypothetical protein